MNLSNTIIPKSDQLNADDLISGPRTIKITQVKAGSTEQPVSICYEGGDGRPYKPSKSMRRVLVSLWGSDGDKYVGRSLTIYRDPNIKFGGDPVGGICISHASHIDEPASISLTVTRGKRKPHRVDPLKIEPEVQIDRETLLSVGTEKAKAGLDALQAWFIALSKAEKHAIKDDLPALKEKAGAS